MSEPKGPKSRYKTTNWAAYNAALKARGSWTIWLDQDMQWDAPASGKWGVSNPLRMIIWPLVEQIRMLLVPLFHSLHRRLAAKG